MSTRRRNLHSQNRLTQVLWRLRNAFYDGPSIFNYPGRMVVGYQSPTLVAWVWIKSWALSWLTVSGRILLAVAFMVGLTGMMSDLMPIYYLSFLIAGIYVVDFLAGRIFRPQLELTRSLPRTATVGVPFKANYRVRAIGNRPAWAIQIDTVMPPLHMRFVDSGLQLDSPPKEPVEVSRTLVASRRGRYHLPLAVADSAFPFGLWRAGCRAPANEPILVLPAFRPLDYLRIPQKGGCARGGETASDTPGQTLHFLSCREYRYGDDPRHVHGPAWARLGIPVVKEYGDENALRTGILLDLRTPNPSFTQYLERELLAHANRKFEALMMATAAIADYAVRQGSPLDVYIPHLQPSALRLQGADPLRELLSVLAVVDPVSQSSDLKLPDTAKAELRELSGIISISAVADETWRTLNKELPTAPTGLIAIALSDKATSDESTIHVGTTDLLEGNVASIG